MYVAFASNFTLLVGALYVTSLHTQEWYDQENPREGEQK
jgi:hypothetical protein